MPWKNFKRFLAKFISQPAYAFQVMRRRGRAYLSYFRGNGRSSFPEAITLFLTHRCNLRCKMCGQWGEGGVTKAMDISDVRQELSPNALQTLIKDVAVFKPNITLFGGEPLLYPGCLDLIRTVKQAGMHCLMITNASLLQKYAREVVDAGLDELNVSLDGGRELHDEIRGLPGLHQTIMSGLQRLNDEKDKQAKKRPFINLQCTITKYNYEHLEQLLDVGSAARAHSLTFHHLIFIGREQVEHQQAVDRELACSSSGWDGFISEPGIDPDRLADTLAVIRGRKTSFSVDVYPNFSPAGLRDYYRNPRYAPREYPARCLSPWIVGYVFPDGSVRPCLNCSYAFGNVTTERFSDIWNSAAAVRYRQTLKQHRMFPACVRCTELYRY